MRPKEVLARLEQIIGVAGSPRRLRDTLEIELRDHFGLRPIEAAEQAERLEEPVRRLIVRTELQCQSNGTLPIVTLSSVSDRSVVGACYIESRDAPDLITAKRRRLQVGPLIDQIRALTFSEFELFGAKVLRELGATTVRVTPCSNDQGIDFYGILNLGTVAGVPTPLCQLAHGVSFRFAGQAKHYPNTPVGPKIVRELIGSVSLARYKVFTGDPDFFEDLELLAFNPLLPMLFTTGRFTRGAIELARKAGIIVSSGEQLAVFLADRGVGISETGDSTVFDSEAFWDWLES